MLNEIVLIVFYVIILLYSIIIHEVAHGFVALRLGDLTAKYAGRLNLNPIKHIDPWGSIFVPILMLLATGFNIAFGWAKPVPYNPYNLKNQKWGPAMVAFGGPGSNIIIAIIATFLARITPIPVQLKIDIINNLQNWSSLATIIAQSFPAIFFQLMIMVIFWNVLLAFFNLIPIPPLDGSKLFFTLFNVKSETVMMLEQYGFLILVFFIVFFSGPLGQFLSLMLHLFFNLTY